MLSYTHAATHTYGGVLVTEGLGHRIYQFEVGRKSVRTPHHFGNRGFKERNKVAIQ